MDNLYQGFNNKDTLVLVVDMVNGFCKKGALASPLIGAIIEPIRDFLSSCPNAKKVFLCDSHDSSSVEMSTFPPHCHTAEEQAIVDELKVFADGIVKKNSVNGTFKLIKEHDISKYAQIVLVGDCTDICITNLALGVKSYCDEYNLRTTVSVIMPLTATYDAPYHNAEEATAAAKTIMRINGINLIY